MIQDVSRRSFIAATAAGAAFGAKEKPAVLGGSKTRTAAWPSWPVIDKTEDDAMLAVLHSRQWYRGGGKSVDKLTQDFADELQFLRWRLGMVAVPQ